jgi:O-methyltransferase involved in polyketide biosynthesis
MTQVSDTSSEERDLSPTALYTAEVWVQGGFEGSHWFHSRETRIVYRVVQLFLFLQRLFRWGLPRLKEGLILRHKALDQLGLAGKPKTVIEVASGLSSRFCRFLSSGFVCHYVEVDLPSMVKIKEDCLGSSEGSPWLNDNRYCRIPGDARSLRSLPLPQGPSPTLVLVEGLLMYFSPMEQGLLFRDVAALLQERGGGTLLFDLVPPSEEPKPGRFGKWMEKQMKKWTRGGSFNKSPQTRQDIENSLIDAGFCQVRSIIPVEVPELSESPLGKVRTQQVIFSAVIDSQRYPPPVAPSLKESG